MEIVTLGVVGDSWCGKSQLLLSYTSNFVRNVYIPTVLDCLWTTVNVDGDFIDLRVWDNTGSDDIEYKRLRPLSYPQTEVFLVCFSLKSRLTLVNVETRWIPEVRTHTEAPFLLVGCKRDDCLKSSLESLDDVVSTEEGEQAARKLGAIKYIETSAIEQSGFTECFNTAVDQKPNNNEILELHCQKDAQDFPKYSSDTKEKYNEQNMFDVDLIFV